MAELSPVPFADLVRRMRREVEVSGAIFDLPIRKWYRPGGDLDFSATHFGRRASTPVGPAAGPHTQLAQNIVLSWLAGGRIMELKTVQVNDQLEIPRPCIHVPNVGFNVEWSQELRVPQSLREYAKAAYLIEILVATRAFGALDDVDGFDGMTDTVYDISVGYDLEGIRSEKVRAFLQGMREPQAAFAELRAELQDDLAEFRDLDLPSPISDCVTLSTFHGCPADQIEAIARYLIADCGLHTILKLNPTLLGFDAVHDLLIERLGYTHIELRREAFDNDLQYDDGLEILRRLQPVAAAHGTRIGAKFTNTLVVANDPKIFPTQTDPYMYLSGPPLHVISMNLMRRFRENLGFDFPVSFSAGINASNFPAAVACGMVPVTTCTDLLRQGGYGRLPKYLQALGREMEKLGVTSREAYVLAACGKGAEAIFEAFQAVSEVPQDVSGAPPSIHSMAIIHELAGRQSHAISGDSPDGVPDTLREIAREAGIDGDALVLEATRIAGRMNARSIVPALADNPAYHAASNTNEPRRIDAQLDLYDCINCDLCISACPNDAIFAYMVEPSSNETARLSGGDGGELKRSPGSGFTIREAHQLAVVEGACNECSNCEVYCPEDGAPFVLKERLFMNREALAAAKVDGFCRNGDTLYARLDGLEMKLTPQPMENRATVSGEGFRLEMSWDPYEVTRGHLAGVPMGFDTAALWRLRTVWLSIFEANRPNMLQAERQG